MDIELILVPPEIPEEDVSVVDIYIFYQLNFMGGGGLGEKKNSMRTSSKSGKSQPCPSWSTNALSLLPLKL